MSRRNFEGSRAKITVAVDKYFGLLSADSLGARSHVITGSNSLAAGS
jgi:hypothetical protein